MFVGIGVSSGEAAKIGGKPALIEINIRRELAASMGIHGISCRI
jgi:hypothetical protein